MTQLSQHTDAMLGMLKDYATRHGLLESHSCLLIVREVQDPKVEAPQQLNMAIVGEDVATAVQTLHYAGKILTAELRAVTAATVGSEPSA
jgi:hypothetical protein